MIIASKSKLDVDSEDIRWAYSDYAVSVVFGCCPRLSLVTRF